MPCNHYKKELLDEHSRSKMDEITHLFDRKDNIIEVIRNYYILRRRVHYCEVYESAYNSAYFKVPMGLSFKHTRATGARGIKKEAE